MAPASKIPAPLLVGGAPKKEPKKKKASYAAAAEFGDKKGRKVRKVLRPKAASGVTASGGTTRTPSKRQVGGGASFSNLLSRGNEDSSNLGPAEDFSKNFGPTHKGGGNGKGKLRHKRKRKLDPFDNPDTVFAGQPGAPESQSYFDLMGDFFEKPGRQFDGHIY